VGSWRLTAWATAPSWSKTVTSYDINPVLVMHKAFNRYTHRQMPAIYYKSTSFNEAINSASTISITMYQCVPHFSTFRTSTFSPHSVSTSKQRQLQNAPENDQMQKQRVWWGTSSIFIFWGVPPALCV